MTDDNRNRHRERTHRDRAGDRCPSCGRPFNTVDRVDVHHNDENAQNGAPDNLRKRCRRCHLEGEHNRPRERTNSSGPSGPRSGPSSPRTSPR